MDYLNVATGLLAVLVAACLIVLRSRRVGESQGAPKQAEEKTKTQIRIFFGSQTGTAEGFADKLVEEAEEYGLVAEAIDMEDFDQEELLDEEEYGDMCHLFMMATYGEGEPTDNSIDFFDWLLEQDADDDDLSHLKYTVFGLGNTQYEIYNAAGKKTYKHLAKRGGKSIFPLGLGDDDGDIVADFNKWKDEGLWPAVCTELGVKCTRSEKPKAKPGSNWTLKTHDTAPVRKYKPNSNGLYDATNPFPAKVTENRELFQSDRSCRHIEVALPGNVKYHTGDHLGVLPLNSDHVIARVANRLNIDLDQAVSLTTTKGKVPFYGAMLNRDVLARYPDLNQTATADVMSALSHFATDDSEAAQLSLLGSTAGAADFKKTISEQMRTIPDVLDMYQSIQMNVAEILAVAPKLQVRYYSISSSHLMSPNSVHLTVAVVTYTKPSGDRHDGVCSTHLQQTGLDGDLLCFVRTSSFHPPADLATPLLLVGPGTGVAPLRGFLHDRQHYKEKGESLGQCEFYFGCRHVASEYLYQDELEGAADSGTITNLHVAVSRDSSERIYVQDLIRRNASSVWRLIESGAHIYICGLVAMSVDVGKALQEVMQGQGGVSPSEAEAMWAKLKADGRFKTDVWS